MTQDERWNIRYEKVKNFIKCEHRNPSKYISEEKFMVYFLKRGRKMLNAGEMAETRFSHLWELLELNNRYNHVNQWK